MKFFVLCCLVTLLHSVEAQQQVESAELQLRRFATLTLDRNNAFEIAGGTLRREAASFDFERASAAFATDAAGMVRAAIVVGKGIFTFTPPTEIERAQLARSFETTSLHLDFNSILFVFADTTESEFRTMAGGKVEGKNEKLRDAFRKGLKQLGRDDQIEDPGFLKIFLEGRKASSFWAYVVPTNGDPLVYNVTPFDEEEVTLQRITGGLFSVTPHHDVLNSFHLAKDYDRPESERYNFVRRLRLEKMTLEGDFVTHAMSSDIEFRASVTLNLRASQDKQRWMFFLLLPDLKVDSVFAADGKELRWFRRKDSYILWIEADKDIGLLEAYTIRVVYHGDLFERTLSGMTVMKSSSWWFPRHNYGDKAMYDQTFRIPEKFKIVCVGEPTEHVTVNGITTTRWVTRRPIVNVSFNLGLFEEYEVKDTLIPPVKVYMTKSAHGVLARGGRTMERQIGEDIANSVFYFQSLFGPPLAKQLLASEIPFSHGEAFMGLLHLAWGTYQASDDKGFDQIFRAHEVAHQWWGIGVQPKTYHDTWLAEGMSDYCGLSYLQKLDGGNELFLKELKRRREELFSSRSYFLGKGQEAAPIWLGWRTETSETSGDYGKIVYVKGSWVIHMLRNLMLDVGSMKEGKFQAALKEFYTTYAGKSADTEDFRKIMERHAGQNLQWFFDQWVYKSAMPVYKFGYSQSKTAEGKFRIHCRVQQSNVPPGFQMSVPIRIDFGEGRVARVRVTIKEPMSEFDLPLVPLEPKEVIFNDLESVLCEVETE